MKAYCLGFVVLGLVLSLTGRAGAQVTWQTAPSLTWDHPIEIVGNVAISSPEENEFQAEALTAEELSSVRDLRVKLEAAQNALSRERNLIEEAHRQKYYRAICPETSQTCVYTPPSCPAITSELQGRYIVLHIVSKCPYTWLGGGGTFTIPNNNQGIQVTPYYYPPPYQPRSGSGIDGGIIIH